MKRVISLFFLLLILFQSGGMSWWFKANQISIHLRMNERLEDPNSIFEKLTISFNEYFKYSINEGNEIKWNGKLFDVKSVRFENNQVSLLVINDSAEENLLLQFTHFINHTRDAQKQVPDYWVKFQVLTYLIPSNEFELHSIKIKNTSLCFQPFANKTVHSKISSPPPKLFS